MKIKNIVLNSDKDFEDFCHKLWIYRSYIFYHNVNFTFENNIENNQISKIIEALNIKNRNKRIEFIYDTACDYIDKYNQENNLSCEFKNHQCLNQYNSKFFNGCCKICKYQSPNGCKSKNLSCKFFYCDEIKKKCKTLKWDDVKILRLYPKRYYFLVMSNYFRRRESILLDLKIGSVLLYCIKIFSNMIRMAFIDYEKKMRKEYAKENIFFVNEEKNNKTNNNK